MCVQLSQLAEAGRACLRPRARSLAARRTASDTRGPPTPAELASYLPDKDGTLLYIDVDAMRRSGILDMMAGSKAAEELEYKEFVEQTGLRLPARSGCGRGHLPRRSDVLRAARAFRLEQAAWPTRSKQGGSRKNCYCVGGWQQAAAPHFVLQATLESDGAGGELRTTWRRTRSPAMPAR